MWAAAPASAREDHGARGGCHKISLMIFLAWMLPGLTWCLDPREYGLSLKNVSNGDQVSRPRFCHRLGESLKVPQAGWLRARARARASEDPLGLEMHVLAPRASKGTHGALKCTAHSHPKKRFCFEGRVLPSAADLSVGKVWFCVSLHSSHGVSSATLGCGCGWGVACTGLMTACEAVLTASDQGRAHAGATAWLSGFGSNCVAAAPAAPPAEGITEVLEAGSGAERRAPAQRMFP